MLGLTIANIFGVPLATWLGQWLGWRADYVALFDEAKGQIDVQGWVTLTNNSGTTYKNATTVLVAGNPRLIGQGYQGVPTDAPDGEATMTDAGTESGTRQRLGD